MSTQEREDRVGTPIPETPPVEPLLEGGGQGSLVDILKEELAELASNTTTYIPVIGHEKSGLAIKYRLPESGKVLDEIARKVEREDSKDAYFRNYYTAIDTIVKLCEGFYVKPYGVEDYVMLDPQESGFPVKFDDRMAEIVGLPAGAPARAIAKKIFGNNELAVAAHAEKLSRWMSNTNADLTLELWQLGN